MPDFLKGVINLRGKVIPVMDVRTRFNMEQREYDDRTCIIVVNINNTSIGLVVDKVQEVVNIPESQVEPSPEKAKGKRSRFLQGMGKINNEVKILLNVEQLLYEEELGQLEQITQC